jgi:hypothetical protein
MGVYSARDIYSNMSGDIEIGTNGDLKIGSSIESVTSAINFILRTDKGGYTPDNRIGADLGTFIGDELTSTMIYDMQNSAIANLTEFVIDRPDIEVRVLPLSNEEAGIIVAFAGMYIDQDGNVLEVSPQTINYLYPYIDGEPRPA